MCIQWAFTKCSNLQPLTKFLNFEIFDNFYVKGSTWNETRDLKCILAYIWNLSGDITYFKKIYFKKRNCHDFINNAAKKLNKLMCGGLRTPHMRHNAIQYTVCNIFYYVSFMFTKINCSVALLQYEDLCVLLPKKSLKCVPTYGDFVSPFSYQIPWSIS